MDSVKQGHWEWVTTNDASVEERLRDAGLWVTQPRKAVLAVLDEARSRGEHLLVSEVVERSRTRIGRLSKQGVYDCLDALTRSGVVRRVETAGSPARFEARVGDNHHHLVCRECGRTVDVDCVVGSAPCLQPSSKHGFEVDEAEVVFWGRCEQCRTAATDPGTVTENRTATEPAINPEG